MFDPVPNESMSPDTWTVKQTGSPDHTIAKTVTCEASSAGIVPTALNITGPGLLFRLTATGLAL